jgi:Fe-Mn family superoxide dismutase
MSYFILKPLPYKAEALDPYISPETISYHYDKHHRGYLNNLNNLIDQLPQDSHIRGLSLEELVIAADNEKLVAIFNNAAQVLNHDFYWASIRENGGGNIANETLANMINETFGSFDNFKTEFIKIGLSQFGSGWVWLVQDNISKNLLITKTGNADNPILHGQRPLITCDVWEHAYYIDYRNKRADYIEVFLKNLVNWDFAASNLIK